VISIGESRKGDENVSSATDCGDLFRFSISSGSQTFPKVGYYFPDGD
jgi:hypothetical protein